MVPATGNAKQASIHINFHPIVLRAFMISDKVQMNKMNQKILIIKNNTMSS